MLAAWKRLHDNKSDELYFGNGILHVFLQNIFDDKMINSYAKQPIITDCVYIIQLDREPGVARVAVKRRRCWCTSCCYKGGCPRRKCRLRYPASDACVCQLAESNFEQCNRFSKIDTRNAIISFFK